MDNRPAEEATCMTCDICKMKTSAGIEDTLHFGEWMNKSDVKVHYFCLLLSTHLPQKGEDHGGILGFLLRDIRKEIHMAKQRTCMYCEAKSANIMCHICKKYYHLVCGHTNLCLSEFTGEFKSYCRACIPLNEKQKQMMKAEIEPYDYTCYICKTGMGFYSPYSWIEAKCCNNGYVHRVCIKKYALNSGYYLICIWCKSKEFREDVKRLGVFVPDRDANWEREKGAYRDLHRPSLRCDMEICHCPKGRDFLSNKWKIIRCTLCGLVGAHNPLCIPGFEKAKQPLKEIKCDTCSVIEHTLVKAANQSRNINETLDIDTSLYMTKTCRGTTVSPHSEITEFSDEDSEDSKVTIINNALISNTMSMTDIVVPLLTQSTETESLLEKSQDKQHVSTDKSYDLHNMNKSLDKCVLQSTETEKLIEKGSKKDASQDMAKTLEKCVSNENGNALLQLENCNKESSGPPPPHLIQMAVDHMLALFDP
ncbi:pineapple eye protein [Stomoxys calcitrans]|uniref:pineapple eye protein n=1 Tax=Stomoxys calcitrans TaxID=35570 RepID=UPI0027E3523E|nr:pineapple eye protein [Stomoxys calcitrans]XP_013099875.2 pineapple eye protein [Stomoxys calcitrans]